VFSFLRCLSDFALIAWSSWMADQPVPPPPPPSGYASEATWRPVYSSPPEFTPPCMPFPWAGPVGGAMACGMPIPSAPVMPQPAPAPAPSWAAPCNDDVMPEPLPVPPVCTPTGTPMQMWAPPASPRPNIPLHAVVKIVGDDTHSWTCPRMDLSHTGNATATTQLDDAHGCNWHVGVHIDGIPVTESSLRLHASIGCGTKDGSSRWSVDVDKTVHLDRPITITLPESNLHAEITLHKKAHLRTVQAPIAPPVVIGVAPLERPDRVYMIPSAVPAPRCEPLPPPTVEEETPSKVMIRIAHVDNHARLEIKTPTGATVRTRSLNLNTPNAGALHVGPGSKYVHISAEGWHASAEEVCLARDGSEVILHGHAEVWMEESGGEQSQRMRGGKIVLHLKDGRFATTDISARVKTMSH
jgi:hypothetical protein